MKKTSKRIISLLLALVMVAGVCAVGFMASAEDDPVYEQITGNFEKHLKDGEEESHTYKESGGNIICELCGFNLSQQYKTYSTNRFFKHPVYDASGVTYEKHVFHVYQYINDQNEIVTDESTLICDVCGFEFHPETDDLGLHRDLIVKKGNTEATCEGFPYDTYRCRHCGEEYDVRTGPELGHYWPVVLNNDGIPQRNEDGDLIADERYTSYEWDETDHEWCKLTFHCQRCDATISYTVYTMEDEIGQIIKSDVNPCTGDQKYTATFDIPNVPKNYDGEFIYAHSTSITHNIGEGNYPGHQLININSLENGQHIGDCSVCDETGIKVDCTYGDKPTDLGNGQHAFVCTVCGYEKDPENHVFDKYSPSQNETGKHTATCKECGFIDTQSCSEFNYSSNDINTHKKVCADCGNVIAASEAHDFGSYKDNGDGTHSKTCTLCGQTADVALHNPSSYVQAGAEGHRAICEDCGAAYLEAHEEGEPVINVTVAPKCLEEGKQDVTVYCTKCNYKISEQKDVTVPALGHDFVDGVCTRCGASRSCASEGHEIDEELGLNYDGVVHYYTCRYCGASVYPDADGKIVNVTVTINSDGATEVSPNAARHAAQDYYLDDVNELHNFEYCTKCAHKHNFVKTGTITGSCETYSYDTYKCTTCEQKVNVRKGDQIGHYWPIELEDDGLTPKVEDGSVVFDEDYVSFKWGAKNESCTITLTCKRPDCGKTVSYTIYTKKTDFGMITKKKTCLGTKYIATFTNLPDIPTGSNGTYVLTTTASVETGTGNHTPGKVLEKVDPTCTEAGYTKYECSKCGEDFKVTTPATGHDYQMKTDATGKTWYECKKCGDSYTLTPCRAGQHIDENFDFVCEKCHSKISFRENWPHYIVGLPMYWIRKAISWLFDGRQGILKF